MYGHRSNSFTMRNFCIVFYLGVQFPNIDSLLLPCIDMLHRCSRSASRRAAKNGSTKWSTDTKSGIVSMQHLGTKWANLNQKIIFWSIVDHTHIPQLLGFHHSQCRINEFKFAHQIRYFIDHQSTSLYTHCPKLIFQETPAGQVAEHQVPSHRGRLRPRRDLRVPPAQRQKGQGRKVNSTIWLSMLLDFFTMALPLYWHWVVLKGLCI